MSRKNNLTTRKNAHKFALERELVVEAPRRFTGKATQATTAAAIELYEFAGEKANQLKREAKAKKTAQKLAAAKTVKKTKKNKGIRLKKGVTVKGIKITDADSKKRAKALLKAEQAMEGMDIDEWEEA